MSFPDTIWHQVEAAEACTILRSSASHGLTHEEHILRKSECGANSLPEVKHRPFWRLFLSQFASPLIYILFVAAAISASIGHVADAGVILFVVMANAMIGTFQEGRAEHSMSALRRLSALSSRVIRGGQERVIEASDLVPGDILLLAAGDAVGADARLLEVAALEVSEAALTGESLPVAKQCAPLPGEAGLADRTNMVFSASHVTAGRARALVVATGQNTEVGKIAHLTLQAAEPRTPLEQRLSSFGHWLTASALILFVMILILGSARGLPLGQLFMVAVSQMVSVVPEGLQVAMTIGLAVGMQRMARHRALVRRLGAVETLGATTVICTDKTGTLTKNEMTVTRMHLPGDRTLEVTGSGYIPEGELLEAGKPPTAPDTAVQTLLEACALCNDAQLVPPDNQDSRWRIAGDPTEAALLVLAYKGGVNPEGLRHQFPRMGEIPFDPATKLMATQHRSPSGGFIVLKGAPEAVLPLCDPATFDMANVKGAAESLAAQSLRLLAVARVESGRLDEIAGARAPHHKVRFLGLVGQMDPPRDGIAAAVGQCRDAGIRPVMVTGDHKTTGLAIARTLGIVREGDLAVDGTELDLMPEQDLRASLNRIAVFARVHPVQKLRIVEAFQSQGHVVAMTGDGVNDAPALAVADVGVAMGITGTEVAKSAAKLVIMDDNFATIVRAVEEGRLVAQNLRKVVLFLFATSLDEVLILLLALLCDLPLPLAAVQILWINIVTEGTVTVNLIMEGLEGDEMSRKPQARSAPLVTRPMAARLLLMAGVSVAVTFGFYLWRLSTGADLALVQSETFTLLAVCQWFNVLNCRSALRSALDPGLVRNQWLTGGLLLGNLLHLLVVYAPPMNRIFHTVPIPLADAVLIGLLGSAVLWVEEIRKHFARRAAAGNLRSKRPA